MYFISFDSVEEVGRPEQACSRVAAVTLELGEVSGVVEDLSGGLLALGGGQSRDMLRGAQLPVAVDARR